MTGEPIAIVDTGAANLASVRAAFRRLDLPIEVTRDAGRVRAAERVVLPGVGAFGAVRRRLAEDGVDTSIRERVEEGRPTLAICLGLHLLGSGSEEAPGTGGLEVVSEEALAFPRTVRCPHLGWNEVRPTERGGVLRRGHAYFAHSYRWMSPPKGWRAAWSDHAGKFVAAIERGALLACQFHPELSGRYGAELIARWAGIGAWTEDASC